MKDIYVDINSEEESKLVQEAWFKGGARWFDGSYVQHTQCPRLYLRGGKAIRYGMSQRDTPTSEKVSLQEALSIFTKETKEEVTVVEFKEGDRVARLDGKTFSNGSYVLTVDTSCGSLFRSEDIVYLKETGTNVPVSDIYKVTPHKMRDLIIAWAEGAAIEMRASELCGWTDATQPSWSAKCEYRIKVHPEKSPQEIEKEEILKEMEQLKARLKKLEVK